MTKRIQSQGEHPRSFVAGHEYAAQEWGPLPAADHALIGVYLTSDGGTITVAFVENGPSGNPEFSLTWSDSYSITVLDEQTALVYLIESGAVEIVDDDRPLL